jgi:protein involved in polysaccharide export with SLBB domain
VVLIDQPYEHGHLIVTNANDEFSRRLTLPTLRPNSLPTPPPQFSDADLKDRAKSIEFIAHLESHKRFYSRAIALNQDPFERASELAAILFSDKSTALGHLENRPLEVVGDYLAYPSTDRVWNALVSAKLEDDVERQADLATVPDERLVTLPTRGVFAEAKLGHCNASEEIDYMRFWDWQQSPIPHFAPEIAPTVPVTPHPEQPNLSATPFPSSIVNVVNPPNAPDPTGLATAMNVLATPNLFRDMSGQTQVEDLLKRLSDNSISIAEASNVARGLQGKSGAGGGGGGGRSTSIPSVGGAPGINGPRANPTQPSAVNSDLRDLQKVLASGQAARLITPEAAQDVFTGAARDAYSPALQLGFAIDAATAGTVNLVAVSLVVGQIVHTEVRAEAGGITPWSHDYPIEPSGNLRIPLVAPVAAAGQTVTQLRQAIAGAIVAAKLFPAVTVNLDVLSAQVDYTNTIKGGEKLFLRILDGGNVSPSSGSYIVDNSGEINIPFLGFIKVSGRFLVDVQNRSSRD